MDLPVYVLLDAGAQEFGSQLRLILSCGPLMIQGHLHVLLTNLHTVDDFHL